MSRFKSNWVKERWATAREQQKLYNERFGEDISVREFYKRPENNPLLQRVRKYAVTFEMKYTDPKGRYEFYIPQETFYIYSLEKNGETQTKIENDTKQAIVDIFDNYSSKQWIENQLEVRGIEDSSTLDYTEVDLNKLKTDNAYNTQIPQAKVTKQKGSSKNVNKYNLKLWV